MTCKVKGCEATENLFITYTARNKNGSTRIYYMCPSCSQKRQRKYRTTESGKQKSYASTRKYVKANPERVKAWRLAEKNIESKPCEVCGEKKTQRHHPDIAKPLYIKHLCPLHHKQAHKAIAL
jgi:hypothetical protein